MNAPVSDSAFSPNRAAPQPAGGRGDGDGVLALERLPGIGLCGNQACSWRRAAPV